MKAAQTDLLMPSTWRTIQNGKCTVQVMPELEAETVPYHPFDLTKVWPKGGSPLIEVGEFELNRNPETISRM